MIPGDVIGQSNGPFGTKFLLVGLIVEVIANI